MDIKIDPEGAKEIVQKAILESLTPQARDDLIAQAVQALTKRPPKEYGAYGRNTDPKTPLEEAFERAVTTICNQVVREYLDDELVKTSIRDQILKVLDDLINEKGTWLYDEIGRAVGKSIADVLTEHN